MWHGCGVTYQRRRSLRRRTTSDAATLSHHGRDRHTVTSSSACQTGSSGVFTFTLVTVRVFSTAVGSSGTAGRHSGAVAVTSALGGSGGGSTFSRNRHTKRSTMPRYYRAPLSTQPASSSAPARPPTPLSCRPSMPLPRTQPKLLILIRQSQRINQPPQQQTMILDDLQQRIRPRLPAIPCHNQRRRPKLSLKQPDLIGRSRRLTQNLDLASIQHELAGYRGPKPTPWLP